MMCKQLALLGLIVILAACGAPKAATPGSTPEAIRVYYPLSLQPWADRLSSCVSTDPAIALFFFQSENLSPEFNGNDILLETGQPSQSIEDRFSYQVGWEQVVVIVNNNNPITQISTDQLQQIFKGRVTRWEGTALEPIQVWVLPEGETTRRLFDETLGLYRPLAAEALLAPGPAAMLEAVAKDENAIGYLPQSFLSSDTSALAKDVKTLQLDPSLVNDLRQPVIALTRSEPSGYERDLLVCLQSSSDSSPK